MHPPLMLRPFLLFLLTMLVGVLAICIPPIAELETSIGLHWLFKLRGPREAPSEVVIISIDRNSSRRFELPNEPRKWPRRYHAELVTRLSQLGARVICFDIIFEEPRNPEEDRQLAEAIREVGNVILFQYLKRDRLLSEKDALELGIQLDMEKLRKPIPILAESGASLAPFPLPKVPARVNRVWTFKKEIGAMPTLPSVALQQYGLSLWDDWRSLLNWAHETGKVASSVSVDPPPDSTRLAQDMRRLFLSDPALAQALRQRLAQTQPAPHPLLTALLSLYSDGNSRYIDFYGPPHSITTIPYYKIFEDPLGGSIDLRGKAVFIGFSEQLQPEQKDGFYTVFSQANGLDVSGVEIAATAFANLLEGRNLNPLPYHLHLLVIIIWAMLLPVLFFTLPGQLAIPSAILLTSGWVGVSLILFTNSGVWMPLVAPLLFQLPVALVGALLWRLLSSRKEHRRIREAFGFFLPSQVVDELVKNLEEIPKQGELVYGVCLATDAEQYTHLSESMAPGRLRAMLNGYYQRLFEPVKRHGGTVSDVVGDAMMAIWATKTPTVSLRSHACHAALEILRAVDDFNRQSIGFPIPTRIGLHGGEILLGNIGAGDHFEYRAVGDIVNTASRIEGLNKTLGTRLLVSAEIVRNLEGITTREIGRFRLKGKRNALTVYELLGFSQDAAVTTEVLRREFAQGLNRFRQGHWKEAAEIFRNMSTQFPTDGPTRYYLGLCERYLQRPPSETWNGVVVLTSK